LYGQGETPMTATYMRAGDHVTDGPLSDRLASCGIPRSGIDLRIMGDDGLEVACGEVGEICVRGPSVMKGYWEQDEATVAALRDGWLRTGDLAFMDNHRFVYILDRSKDMIITGGSNVYPREVEEILMQHDDVLEVCVIGIPDDLWGEVVVALVVLKEGAIVDEQDLIAVAATRLASYKKPRSVYFVKQLPKNTYGKVLKRQLRDQYRQLLQSTQKGSALSQ
jgi:acyl-CoA synthetase (AMP-forming)/AMP-acid ligase II